MEWKVGQVSRYLVKKITKKESGYTIVEMLLVLLLMFLVISIVTLTYFTAVNSSKQVIDTASAKIDARTAMYSISKEIRGATEIFEAETDKISFKSQNEQEDSLDDVSYYLKPQQGYYTLYASINGEERFIVTDIIDNSLFSYFSSKKTELSAPLQEGDLSKIGIVGINIIIDRARVPSERTMKLGTLVTLRNRS